MWRSPVQGDLVISKTADTSMPYRVRFHGGTHQFVAFSREAARRQAVDVAQAHRRNVWYTDDERTFICVDRFRLA